MKKIFAILVGAIVWAAIAGLAFMAVPPPAKVHAQLSSPQTWAGSAGGTSTALTVTIHNVVALNDLLGVPIRVLPSGTNNGPSTLQVNIDTGGNLGAIAIQRPTSNLGLQAVSGGEMQTGQMVEFTYDGTVFEISSPIDMTPVGHTVDIRNSSGLAPLGTLLEDGSCYSQTTYAALFSVIGTTYNAGAPVACSGGQFAVPRSNGTVFAAADNQGTHGAANNITGAGSGCNATGITACGAQNQTLSVSQIPTLTLSANGVNAITVLPGGGNTGIPATTAPANVTQSSCGTGPAVCPASTSSSWGGTSTFTGNNNISVSGNTTNTGGQAHPILPPLLIGYRAIKY